MNKNTRKIMRKQQFYKKISSIINYIYSNRKLKTIAKYVDIDNYFEKNRDVRSVKVVLKNTRITPEEVYELYCVNYLEICDSKTEVDMKEIIKKLFVIILVWMKKICCFHTLLFQRK